MNGRRIEPELPSRQAALGADILSGRSELRLNLPADALIDVEDALAAVHEAQSAIALRQWRRAWASALPARFVTRRRLLPEHDTPWLAQWRQRLDDVHDRALEAYAASCLGIGGAELPGTERAARNLLMDALAAQGPPKRCASTITPAPHSIKNWESPPGAGRHHAVPECWSCARSGASGCERRGRVGGRIALWIRGWSKFAT